MKKKAIFFFEPYFYCGILALILNACGATPSPSSSTSGANTTVYLPGQGEPATRIIFHVSNFSNLSDYVAFTQTQTQCLGDILKAYYVNGDDFSGVPTAFPLNTTVADELAPTTRPSFVKNVSVDMTNTYFVSTQPNVVQTDQCSYRAVSSAPLPSFCADFDQTPPADPAPTIVPTATPSPTLAPTVTPTSTPYYGTNFYRTRDDWCDEQGPIISADTETTKSYVGGVNIDLDRTQLGASEDLLLMMTYHALDAGNNIWPSTQYANDHTILSVSLVGTQESLATLIGVKQPRQWTYYNSPASYPVYLNQIALLDDPYGSLRTAQIYIPLAQNPLIDRIRIDRIRGSYHLYQIDLYRLGNR